MQGLSMLSSDSTGGNRGQVYIIHFWARGESGSLVPRPGTGGRPERGECVACG